MPMPMPHDDENHDEFMDRCHREMRNDMKDGEQRNAACERQWKERDKEMKTELLYPRIRSYVMETPWAVLPSTLATILDVLAYRAQGGRLTTEEIQQRIGAVSRPATSQAGNIAILPLFGVLGYRMGSMTEMSGGTSTERFAQQFRSLMADPSIGAIILDINSPGGEVSGVDELATEIYRARGVKTIAAIANPLAASAAYWIGSAVGELSVIPSGEVGSIGVVAAHENLSKQREMLGIETTIVSAGRYKVDGNPFQALSEEAKADIQARVNDYYGAFVRAVARNRGVSVEAVKVGYGEGRVVGAKQALDLGMVDRVETVEQMIGRLARQLRPGRGGVAASWTGAVASGTGDTLLGFPVQHVDDPALDSVIATLEFGDPIVPVTSTGGETATVSPIAAGPLPPHKSPAIAPDDAPWDGPAEVAKANGAMELRRMHAWMDDEGDPEAKSSYKMPHHMADGTLVPAGCTAVMGAMHGGRGGVDIPEGDRAGVNRHMERHYEEMSKPMPMMDGAATGLGVDARRRRLRLAGRA